MRSTRIDPRCQRLSEHFCHAVAAVRGRPLAAAALRGKTFEHVIALGKAGESLAAGAWEVCGDSIRSGFVAMPRGYATGELSRVAPFERWQGAHPIPDESSLQAGAALLRYARSRSPGSRVAVLVSGGASACVEVPSPGIDIDFLRRTNAWLLASGLTIIAMNRVRMDLSLLKGGGLAHALAGCETQGFVMVDVADEALEWVGGAPLASPEPGPLPAVPDWLRERLVTDLRESSGEIVSLQRLAGNREAVAAVVHAGAEFVEPLQGDAEAMAARITEHLRTAPSGLFVWGGETDMHLPLHPGRGGRCRHLALAVARILAGRCDWRLLAGATDGWDGSDAVAGACVDGDTLARGTAQGLDADAALRQADSGTFLEACGDAFALGPTGTNVNDLVIAEKRRAEDSAT